MYRIALKIMTLAFTVVFVYLVAAAVYWGFDQWGVLVILAVSFYGPVIVGFYLSNDQPTHKQALLKE